MKTVLIVTNSQDLHAELVCSQLDILSQPYFRVNLDQFPREYSILLKIERAGEYYALTHSESKKSVTSREVGAVWIRKNAQFSFKSDNLPLQEKQFAIKESEHVLNSFIYSIDAYWMSHPTAIRASQWKGEQALRARKFGFSVPSARISNSPDCIKEFKQSLTGEMITKTMSSPYLAAEKVTSEHRQQTQLTTTIVTDELMEEVDAVVEFPCYFQELIEKAFELRVTVIGNQVFAAKIDSQFDPRTVIDSRDISANIPYTAYDISPQLASQCVEFVHSYNLQYGAIDLIVTKSNDVVFLENNPAGQFYYIQQLVPELKMIEEVAKCLHKNCQ